ncbi:MAG TPA: EAL domain-containing protein [Acidimicrobiales bacterium]|nr:EAL domain-containing protein [Acidimicrobiales bacterium]
MTTTTAPEIRTTRFGRLLSVYQPIVDLRTRTVLGYEALARFSDSAPDAAFAEAERCGQLVELESQALQAALAGLDDVPEGCFLSVNVSPATVLSDGFGALLAGRPVRRLVVEVVETTPVPCYDALVDALRPWRGAGLRVAVDDLGSGFARLSHLTRLRPDVVKLDRALVSGLDGRPLAQAMAATLSRYARTSGVMLVGEGVEEEAEAAALTLAGVCVGQGWLFGRPGPLRSR